MTAKFSHARRKVKIAAGVAKATSRTNFGLITMQGEIAAACSRNGFLESPFLKKQSQFYPFFGPKTAICPKTKPKQTQFKPKQSQMASMPKCTYTLYWQCIMKIYDYLNEMKTNPKQTQFLSAALFGGFGDTGRKKADLSRRSSEGTKTDEGKQEI